MSRRFSFRPPSFNEWASTDGPDFPGKAEQYALRVRAFYDSRAQWHRRFYRLSGATIIVVGGSLPVLASLQYAAQALVVSIAGVTVGVVTALRAFYRWDMSWVLLRRTEIRLTAAYLTWKGSTDAGSAEPQRQRAAAATLLAEVLRIRDEESEKFFRDLPLPQPPKQS